jgi:hypothetical protein
MAAYHQRWDVDNILRQLNLCSAQVNSSYNDGFTAWSCKKDLLTVKYHLDQLLSQAPKFSHVEEEFVNEMEKQKTWKALNVRSST